MLFDRMERLLKGVKDDENSETEQLKLVREKNAKLKYQLEFLKVGL